MRKVFSFAGLALSTLYILNPTFGVFELLPDNLPWIGNLDEATATALIIYFVKDLGWYPKFLTKDNKKQIDKS